MLLQTEDLTVRFTNGQSVVEALDHINLSLIEGKIYALFGPSGSGKTTLLNVLSGLLIPTLGKVYFQGQELPTGKDKLAKYRREEIGLVFQNLLLVDNYNALENILIGANKDLQGEIEKATQVLDYLQIKEITNLDIGLLSGGERQRVAIARCLLNDPKMILMDEPTANLDYENATKIMELSRDLAHNYNKCVVIVTHDSRLLHYVDEVIEINDGKVVM
jgi:putative ABC transport system ATP-binding protein